jgi:hypothetical protein
MFVKERFFQKVCEDGSGCHLWTGARNIWGYGRHKINGKTCAAHRTAWELVNGSVPVGLLVLHHCDNPRCVNPAHLYVGTQADNMRDMMARGRRPKSERAVKPKRTVEPRPAAPETRPITRERPILIQPPKPERVIRHRDGQLVLRVASPLKRELELAAEEEHRSVAAVVRAVLIEWATQRTPNEAANNVSP